MSEKSAWKDNSDNGVLRFDFMPTDTWPNAQLAKEMLSITADFEKASLESNAVTPGWKKLVEKIPKELRQAIAAELHAGNIVTSISSSGWPSSGSIVVSMRDPFSVARHSPPLEVAWREVNDPHYWRQELCQKMGDIEFLVIT